MNPFNEKEERFDSNKTTHTPVLQIQLKSMMLKMWLKFTDVKLLRSPFMQKKKKLTIYLDDHKPPIALSKPHPLAMPSQTKGSRDCVGL